MRWPTSPRGFSLVEMIIALMLLTVVLGSLFGLIVRAQREYVRQREAVRVQEGLRLAEGSIAWVLRSAGADPYERGAALLDPDPLQHGVFDNLRVVSDFNPADGDVDDLYEDLQVWIDADTLIVRLRRGEPPRPMVHPVRSLEFWYFSRDGSAISVPSAVGGANRVRFRIEAPRDPRTGTTEARETSVFLRNRS